MSTTTTVVAAPSPSLVDTAVEPVVERQVEAAPPPCSGTASTAPEPDDGRDLALSIAEVAERTGVTAHTLRYYERIGLLSVPRGPTGHRIYTRNELNRVVFITRLRLTAMPIREIQAYFALVAEGPGNEDQRLALLEAHRDQVKTRITDLESALGVIEFKIATYGGNCLP